MKWNKQDFLTSRQGIVSLYYGFALLVFGFKFTSGILLHQTAGPPLYWLGTDTSFWLWFATGIPQALIQSFSWSLLVDLLLLGSAMAAIVMPRFRLFPILFTLSLFCYYSIAYAYFINRGHMLSGFFLFSFLPWFKSERRFELYFSFLRYFLLYILASAACWKLYNGVVFRFDNQMSYIIKMQLAEYVVHHPGTGRLGIVNFITAHPAFGNLLLKGGFLLQFSCLIGFFTRRFDRILVFIVLAFFIGDLVVMNLPFYEMYILVLTLLRKRQI